MPSLNVAKYISECMESVLNQTLKDIEILAIDGGSTDGTWEILKSYADKDTRVHLIKSDKKSYGYQVNLGLAMAQGEYIGIVETDDWIERDSYEVLYGYACQYGADYVRGIGESYITYTEESLYTFPIYIFTEQQYDINNGVIQINPSQMETLFSKDFHLWNGIYDRTFLTGIVLNETEGAAYQDLGFLSQVYCKATKAIYVKHLVYHYRKDNDASSLYNHKAFRYLINEYRFVQEHLPINEREKKILADVRFFGQVCGHFGQMAEEGIYWEEENSFILQIQDYFKNRYDVRERLSSKWKEAFDLFMKSPILLYHDRRKASIEWEECWHNRLRIYENRVIVIYGSGTRGHYFQCILASWQVGKVIGFCDSDSRKWGKRLHGLPVEGLEYWKKNSPDVCYVITVDKYYHEIEKYLLENEINDNNILFFDKKSVLSVLLRKKVKIKGRNSQ